MPAEACPNCAKPRQRGARFCRHCAFDFWKAAAGEPPLPLPTGRSRVRGGPIVWGILGVIAVAIGIVAVVLIGSGPQPPSTVPPSGDIWFGERYDPITFEIRDPTTTVRPNSAFVMVAHVAHPVEASAILMRMLRDGTLVRTAGPDLRWDSGELLGFTMTAPLGQGTWRYELTDLGGTLLAAGELEVR